MGKGSAKLCRGTIYGEVNSMDPDKTSPLGGPQRRNIIEALMSKDQAIQTQHNAPTKHSVSTLSYVAELIVVSNLDNVDTVEVEMEFKVPALFRAWKTTIHLRPTKAAVQLSIDALPVVYMSRIHSAILRMETSATEVINPVMRVDIKAPYGVTILSYPMNQCEYMSYGDALSGTEAPEFYDK
eukprot:gene15547-4676_t